MMSNYAFRIRATKEYYQLLVLAFNYYKDHVDLSIYGDFYLVSVISIYNILVDSNNHRSGIFFFDLCFLDEDDYYIFAVVIEFTIKNCAIDNSTLARFLIMDRYFICDPKGQVITLL